MGKNRTLSKIQKLTVGYDMSTATVVPEPRVLGNTEFSIRQGDVLDVLRILPDDYCSGVLCDPPYELGFMSKGWDKSGIACSVEMWAEVLRVMEPGTYLLAFGGTRTFHRLTCAIEDAGFQVRDHLMWLYGTGFPKSQACLKPGYEPIVLARKPLKTTLPLNIDGARINPGKVVTSGGGNFAQWRRLEGRNDVPVHKGDPLLLVAHDPYVPRPFPEKFEYALADWIAQPHAPVSESP
jgi:hypothetical protein